MATRFQLVDIFADFFLLLLTLVHTVLGRNCCGLQSHCNLPQPESSAVDYAVFLHSGG